MLIQGYLVGKNVRMERCLFEITNWLARVRPTVVGHPTSGTNLTPSRWKPFAQDTPGKSGVQKSQGTGFSNRFSYTVYLQVFEFG
jgi:hypothetical protein